MLFHVHKLAKDRDNNEGIVTKAILRGTNLRRYRALYWIYEEDLLHILYHLGTSGKTYGDGEGSLYLVGVFRNFSIQRRLAKSSSLWNTSEGVLSLVDPKN